MRSAPRSTLVAPPGNASRPRRYVVRALTFGNALCGFAAIAALASDAALPLPAKTIAALCLGLAIVCDALDGRAARRLGVASHLGGELDSLADAVSFGVVPALVLVQSGGGALAVVAALAHVLAVLFRLARFNVHNDPSPEAHRSFTGLPCTVPALAIAVAAALLPAGAEAARALLLPLASLGLSALMVSRVRVPNVLVGQARAPAAPATTR